MSAPPSRNSIAGTGGSAPSNATARTGFGALWDYMTGLLGASGDAVDARAALGLVIGTNVQAYDTDIPTVAASQAEMETGTEAAIRSMSPLRVQQAITTLGASAQILPISALVGSNALTIGASALSLDFRSTTLGSGTVTRVTGTPSNLVISSGSTLGTVSGVQSDIVVLAINNAGTIELAAVNLAGGVDLAETGLISTTAEGGAGAADSASTIYSATARTNVAYRVIGIIRSTQATAGTWATAPSLIQGAGGQAVAAMSSLGYGQTWQSVTRNSGTTYYNATGKPISLSLVGQTTSAALGQITISINGGAAFTIVYVSGTTTNAFTGYINIPAGASYLLTMTSIGSIGTYELR